MAGGDSSGNAGNMISDEKIGLMYNIMKKILRLAIKAGGDSMSDFRNIYGEAGKFQNYHQVYRREGKNVRAV